MQLEYQTPTTPLMKFSDMLAVTGLFSIFVGLSIAAFSGHSAFVVALLVGGIAGALLGSAGMWAAVDRQAEHDLTYEAQASSRRILSNIPPNTTSVTRLHVVPIDEQDRHTAGAECRCHPTESEPCLFVHHPFAKFRKSPYTPGDTGWKFKLEDFKP